VGLEALVHALLPRAEALSQPRAFGAQHLEQLPAPGAQSVELLRLGIGQEAHRGAPPLREEREAIGVDAIGLRELARGFGEVPPLARVRDHDGPADGGEGCHAEQLVATGGLEHDQLRGLAAEALHQRADPALVVRHRPPLARRVRRHHELRLRDIHPDPHRSSRGKSPRPVLVRILARPSRPPPLFGLVRRTIGHAAPANARC